MRIDDLDLAATRILVFCLAARPGLLAFGVKLVDLVFAVVIPDLHFGLLDRFGTVRLQSELRIIWHISIVQMLVDQSSYHSVDTFFTRARIIMSHLLCHLIAHISSRLFLLANSIFDRS